MTVTDRQSLAATAKNPVDTPDRDLVQLAVDAATGDFSSSVVIDYFHSNVDLSSSIDVDPYVVGDLTEYPHSRWLPLRASLKRGQSTIEG